MEFLVASVSLYVYAACDKNFVFTLFSNGWR